MGPCIEEKKKKRDKDYGNTNNKNFNITSREKSTNKQFHGTGYNIMYHNALKRKKKREKVIA